MIAQDTYMVLTSFIINMVVLLILLLILEYYKNNGNSCGIPLYTWLEIFFIIYCLQSVWNLNMLWITRYAHRYRIHFVIGSAILFGLAIVIWVIYGYSIYFSDENDCQKNSDTCFWLVIMIIILFIGLFWIIAFCCLICCGPFLYCYYRRLMEDYEQSQRGPTHISGSQIDTVVGGLARTQYDPQQFKYESSCKICMVDYDDTDEVTQLKCDPRHYFHTDCIIRWI